MRNKVIKEVSEWGVVVELELERSALLNEQVVLQRNIISLLITGSSIFSTEVKELAARAQDVAGLLFVLDSRVDAIRGNLLN